MSIPLDCLYYYIENVAQDIQGGDVLIYRFFPHGSKNLADLSTLHSVEYIKTVTSIELICHDQEPLQYDVYQHNQANKFLINDHGKKLFEKNISLFDANLRYSANNIYDKCLLLHSEKNSTEAKKYSLDQYILVYYWSHALIALDWFRYAQHVNTLKNKITKKFLIYNRAWSGSREYRLKFLDLLIDYNLLDSCQTSCSFVDSNVNEHYKNYQFNNPIWKPTHTLETHLQNNLYSSCASADINFNDYKSTDIEVVLETLFDDSRIHLTEKTLRPIATGHPFILVSTLGSLEYLREYGFKTFNSIIDESYDKISDPYKRLTAVVELMRDINQLSPKKYSKLLENLNTIALYNKQHFFSDKFFKIISDELSQNFRSGINELVSTNTYSRFLNFRATLDKTKLQSWRKERLTDIQKDQLRIIEQVITDLNTGTKY